MQTLTLKRIDDYDCHPMDLGNWGEYTDRPDWYSNRLIIDRKLEAYYGGVGRNYEHGDYRFWQSEDLSDSEEWFRKNGYCRHDVYTIPRRQARETFERLENFGYSWGYQGFVLETDNDRQESLWGIEVEFNQRDNDYLLSAVVDLAHELGFYLLPEEAADLLAGESVDKYVSGEQPDIVWQENGYKVELFHRGYEIGRDYYDYRFFDNGQLIFEGDRYSPSPLSRKNDEKTVGGLLVFLSCGPEDTDAEYCQDYRPSQLAWVNSWRAEELSLLAYDLEEI